MDPIADFLTRIRNAIKANHRIVEVPSSNLKKQITRVLHENGFIQNYKFEDSDAPGMSTIKIALKYNPDTKVPAIQHITRASSPGLRRYAKATKLPRVLNGLGVAILSTNKGVMTEKEAKRENVGGEVLCYIY
jgi:small subunit ribosomal protein S8